MLGLRLYLKNNTKPPLVHTVYIQTLTCVCFKLLGDGCCMGIVYKAMYQQVINVLLSHAVQKLVQTFYFSTDLEGAELITELGNINQ